MRTRLTLFVVVLMTALGIAAAASAALLKVTATGGTANTTVGAGDPCGTGLTGPNACNAQTIVVEFLIDTGTAPADGEAAGDHGLYRIAAATPVFLTGTLTINGHVFQSLVNAPANADQYVEIWDELNTSGITDRVFLSIQGFGMSDSFNAAANLLLGQVISGDSLLELAGPFSGSPVLPGSGANSFNVSNALGQVQGSYGITSVSFATVPEPALAALLGIALLAGIAIAGR